MLSAHKTYLPGAGESVACFAGPGGAAPSGLFEAHVIFTTWAGTESALLRLGHWAHSLDARIVLWSFQVVPRQFSWSSPPVSVAFIEDRLRSMAQHCCESAEINVRHCLCTDREQCLLNVLRPGSLVLLGGRARWWRTSEQKLARFLQSCGHQVLFVDTGRGTAARKWAAA